MLKNVYLVKIFNYNGYHSIHRKNEENTRESSRLY